MERLRTTYKSSRVMEKTVRRERDSERGQVVWG
jgi:hypothetical protein